VTSNTIIELIVKQRDVNKTSALLVTHRLQDAFTMATHQFDKEANRMVALPPGQHCEVPLSFLILRDGKGNLRRRSSGAHADAGLVHPRVHLVGIG